MLNILRVPVVGVVRAAFDEEVNLYFCLLRIVFQLSCVSICIHVRYEYVEGLERKRGHVHLALKEKCPILVVGDAEVTEFVSGLFALVLQSIVVWYCG